MSQPTHLGTNLIELMALLARRQELEERFRRSKPGEERSTLRRKLKQAQLAVRALFR